MDRPPEGVQGASPDRTRQNPPLFEERKLRVVQARQDGLNIEATAARFSFETAPSRSRAAACLCGTQCRAPSERRLPRRRATGPAPRLAVENRLCTRVQSPFCTLLQGGASRWPIRTRLLGAAGIPLCRRGLRPSRRSREAGVRWLLGLHRVQCALRAAWSTSKQAVHDRTRRCTGVVKAVWMAHAISLRTVITPLPPQSHFPGHFSVYTAAPPSRSLGTNRIDQISMVSQHRAVSTSLLPAPPAPRFMQAFNGWVGHHTPFVMQEGVRRKWGEDSTLPHLYRNRQSYGQHLPHAGRWRRPSQPHRSGADWGNAVCTNDSGWSGSRTLAESRRIADGGALVGGRGVGLHAPSKNESAPIASRGRVTHLPKRMGSKRI